ncbi:hypothetical protein ABZ853_11365 [Streptomyces albidoflavus]
MRSEGWSTAPAGPVGAAVRTTVVHAGRTGRTAVRRAFRPAVGTTVMDTGRTGRTAVRGSFRSAVGAAVVHAGRTGRATVGRAFRPAVGSAVVDTGGTRRTAVRRTLRGAVGTTVMDTRRAGRSTVRGAFLLVRVLLGVAHLSSRASWDWASVPAPRRGAASSPSAPPESAYRYGMNVTI